jgi:hypothetical protein
MTADAIAVNGCSLRTESDGWELATAVPSVTVITTAETPHPRMVRPTGHRIIYVLLLRINSFVAELLQLAGRYWTTGYF